MNDLVKRLRTENRMLPDDKTKDEAADELESLQKRHDDVLDMLAEKTRECVELKLKLKEIEEEAWHQMVERDLNT